MKRTTNHKTLKGLFNLDHNIKIYIPSTVNVDKTIDTSRYIDAGMVLLSKCFGGSTSYEAIGAWQSEEKGLVKEKITIIESYATKKQVTDHSDKIISFCEKMKKNLI